MGNDMSLSVGYPERLCSGYLDSKICHPFQPYYEPTIVVHENLVPFCYLSSPVLLKSSVTADFNDTISQSYWLVLKNRTHNI